LCGWYDNLSDVNYADPNGKDAGISSNGSLSAPSSGSLSAAGSIDGGLQQNALQASLNEKLKSKVKKKRSPPFGMTPPSATDGCLARGLYKAASVVRWVFNDFTLGHLVWIKLIFLFQSASMTVLYPYINLHMKVRSHSLNRTYVFAGPKCTDSCATQWLMSWRYCAVQRELLIFCLAGCCVHRTVVELFMPPSMADHDNFARVSLLQLAAISSAVT
jgi:hypothetical protein